MGKGGWVMLLGVLSGSGMLAWVVVFVVVPVALVSPAVWAKRRHGAALAAIILGTWVGAGQFFEMLENFIRTWRDGEMIGWFWLVIIAVYAAIFGTGLLGVWRWFRLPRR